MTQRIIIAIEVPDGVSVQVRQDPALSAAPPPERFPPIGASASHPPTPTDVCPVHHVEWKGEPGDLFHKKPDGKWCRHPDNTPRPR